MSNAVVGALVLMPIFAVGEVPDWNMAELPTVAAPVKSGKKPVVPEPVIAAAGWNVHAARYRGVALRRTANRRRGQHESRRWQASNGFRIACFQRIGHSNQKEARPFRLARDLHRQPAGLAGGEHVLRKPLAGRRPKHNRVVSALVRVDILRFHPKRRTTLRLFVKEEGDSGNIGPRLAMPIRQGIAEPYERRYRGGGARTRGG